MTEARNRFMSSGFFQAGLRALWRSKTVLPQLDGRYSTLCKILVRTRLNMQQPHRSLAGTEHF